MSHYTQHAQRSHRVRPERDSDADRVLGKPSGHLYPRVDSAAASRYGASTAIGGNMVVWSTCISVDLCFNNTDGLANTYLLASLAEQARRAPC